ncbi:MAG TPA: VWA domain-containing protein [Gemmataceae bacterium]|nr:VWA domain-containing protein [Gemmataceae bacterium]
MLLHPIWLFLAIPLALSLWLWRLPSRLLLILRGLTLLLLLLALCGAVLRLPSQAGTIVVVADRSQSMPPNSATAQKEAIDLLQKAMGPDDRLAVVAFGRTAAVERPPTTGQFPGFVHEVGDDASNLADGLETALTLIPRDAPGKIFVLSDGRWSGRDPAVFAARAAARNLAIDYRPLQRSTAQDLAIARIEAPPSVAPGESFLLTAWVRSPIAQTVSFELRRGEERLSSGEQRLASGLNRLTFRDRADEPGTQSYTLTVLGGENDPVPENNRAHFLVGVQGPRPILHVTEAKSSGLAKLLQTGRLPVKVQSPEACRWSLEELSKYSAVLLENLPAEKIGAAGMENLAVWVRETGSGLMMTGGRNSYGPGGYFRSPLDPLLPVSMELRNEHRKLSLAMVVALDRSGSMAVPVGGGRAKMDLANEGAAQVLDLLSPMDEFGVLAVDTIPHTIANLAPVKNKQAVKNNILGIHSQGGGIFIYVALEAASEMLLKATAGTRHIILFADANDSEEPGRYEELLAQCKKAGITVSVIGLGTPKDKDAELLRDIAKRGNGRIFFTDKPEELPRLFAQDTFVVARNTFLDVRTPIESTPGLSLLAGRPFDLSQTIDGFNLCYLRSGATLATRTVDEYKAPIVASWRAGTGRVLCYTGEADGKYAGPMTRWKDVGAYYTSLARWVAGPVNRLPADMLLTQDVKNGLHRVQLHLDPERQGDPFAELPRVTVLRARPGQPPQSYKTALRWTGADTLGLEIALQGRDTALATVEVPGCEPVALPPVCLPYSPEFQPVENGRGLATLERLARASGGKERVDLSGAWKELPRHVRLVSIAPWLLGVVVLLLLLEVFERRSGLLSRQGRLVRETVRQRRARTGWFSRKRPHSAVPVSSPSAPPPAPEPPPVRRDELREPARNESAMVEALRKARERTRGRIE